MLFFKNNRLLILSLLCSSIGSGALAQTVSRTQERQATERPNIVVFFVDDLGWQDMSEPFYKVKTPINEKFHTPYLELLAKDATKFTNAYATPVCTPSRVSF
ncbi:MAG: sulfatase-like hydrolase/transferase, partial [Sphingobacterium sp.]